MTSDSVPPVLRTGWIRAVFGLSAVFDAVVGVAFLVAARSLCERAEVPPPNHLGYVQFPALLLLVFAAMFARIAADPLRHRDLMPYGIGLKAAFCATVFGHQVLGDIPSIWVGFAWGDLAFLVAFAAAWFRTAPRS